MPEGAMPARKRAAAQGFGDVAREVVRAGGGGRFSVDGMSLSSHFQPLYCVRRGTVVGYEALVRAESPDGPLRARALFESMDRGAKIRFDWLCRALHLRNFAVIDPGKRKLHLNVHPVALVDDEDDGRGFAELVRFYGLSPERVVLEVLESDCGDESRLGESAAAHRAIGFSIAMDHFGQGRSNFDRVARLRPRLVKLDRSTLDTALGDTKARRMMPSMIEMLRDTGADVAIKGIDNAREALAAIESGANFLQGFHLGPPSQHPRDESLARELIQSARRLAAA